MINRIKNIWYSLIYPIENYRAQKWLMSEEASKEFAEEFKDSGITFKQISYSKEE